MLHRTLHQAVLNLQRHKWRPAAQIGQGLHLGDTPCRCVTDTQVENFAITNEIVEGAHHLIRRGSEIPCVQIEQIDAVCIELPQAGLNGADEIVAVIPACIGVTRFPRHSELGGQHDAIAFRLDHPPENFFRAAVGIVHRGIDKVAATFDIGIKDALRFRVIRAPSPVRAKGHGPQRKR